MSEAFLEALAAAEAIRKGEITSQELVRACLARIKEQTAGKSVGFDDGGYTAVLWNDDYSNRVYWLGRRDILARAEALDLDWIYHHRGALPAKDPRLQNWELVTKRVMGGRKDVRSGWLYRRRR